MADAAQAFRMPNQQMAARLQLLRQFADQSFLRGPVEVNHHVAAKNQIEALCKWIVRLPVVMLTAESGRDNVIHIARLGVRDYLVKPFKEDQLIDKVSRIVQLKKKETTAPVAAPAPAA
jgi:PleD family two-component response regulator